MDITDLNVVNQLINEINTEQNIERKEDIYEGHRILGGELKHFVEKRLTELWPQSAKWFRISNASLTKKIITRLAKAYQEPPERVLESESETQRYQELVKAGGLNKAMNEFDRTFNLDKYACLWTNLLQRPGQEDKYVFRTLNQSEFDRIVNRKTMETEVVIVSMPSSLQLEQIHGDSQLSIIQDEPEDNDEVSFYALWTNEQHVVAGFDKKTKKAFLVTREENPNNENPLGRLPFTFMQRGRETSVPPRPSLPYNDIELNACKSILLTGCDIQALGKQVFKHPEDQPLPKEIFDSPFTHIDLPQSTKEGAPETSVSFESYSPNIEDFSRVLEDYERAILDEEGIGTAQLGEAKFSSGFDRAVALKSELDIIEQNQMKYSEVESDVYEIVKLFEESKSGRRFNSEDIRVLFPKQQPIKSREQILADIEKEIELGTILPWEKHMRLDPNLTEEQAREREEEIQELKTEKLRSLGAFRTNQNSIQPGLIGGPQERSPITESGD